MNKKIFKEILILVMPLLLFAVLLTPYSWVNREFIVDWLGCGCPTLDSNGNMIESRFNANDFTALFWVFVSLCVTVWAIFLSRRISKNMMWMRAIYIIAMFAVSIAISYNLHQQMMWN